MYDYILTRHASQDHAGDDYPLWMKHAGDCTLYSSGKIAARPKSKAETTDVEQLSNDRDDDSAGPEDED